jgi:hypothetical protein
MQRARTLALQRHVSIDFLRKAMRRQLCLCLLLSLPETSIAAQERPDFSGNWVLVNPGSASSDAARQLTVRLSDERPFTVLSIQRRSTNGMSSETYQIGLVGGIVAGLESTAPGQVNATRFSTKWDGDSLVIETGSYSGLAPAVGPYTEHSEVWSLAPPDKLVIVVTDRTADSERTTARLAYRRSRR